MANTIHVVGQLLTPMNNGGKFVEIRLKCLENNSLMPKYSVSKIKTAKDGSYDFELVYGAYSVEIVYSNKFNKVEHINVDASTTSPIELPQLLIDAAIACPP